MYINPYDLLLKLVTHGIFQEKTFPLVLEKNEWLHIVPNETPLNAQISAIVGRSLEIPIIVCWHAFWVIGRKKIIEDCKLCLGKQKVLKKLSYTC